MVKSILIIGGISLLIIFGIYAFFNYRAENGDFNRILKPDNQQTECTTDAKMCPDGTAVGRTGPNCEFAACPAEAEDITVKGTMICLPHRDTSGPQTLECAFGLKGDDGKNYALSDPGWKFLIGASMNTEVTVTGKLKPSTDQKYDTAGTIEITNLEK